MHENGGVSVFSQFFFHFFFEDQHYLSIQSRNEAQISSLQKSSILEANKLHKGLINKNCHQNLERSY